MKFIDLKDIEIMGASDGREDIMYYCKGYASPTDFGKKFFTDEFVFKNELKVCKPLYNADPKILEPYLEYTYLRNVYSREEECCLLYTSEKSRGAFPATVLDYSSRKITEILAKSKNISYTKTIF
jgi:hypothetical protein